MTPAVHVTADRHVYRASTDTGKVRRTRWPQGRTRMEGAASDA